MMKYVLGAAAAVMMSTSAMAAVDCGPLPNPKWSWSIGATTTSTQTEIIGDIEYNRQGNVGKADVEITVTTTTVCTALNPQGKVNLDHSTTISTSTTTMAEDVVVCNPSGNPVPVCTP
ncbi:MAG: hypothetical protein Q8M31_22935 [Beijerinckiaceae bacterium]|nr:hypothetical protein [Beijerinckiaceae bacterium]